MLDDEEGVSVQEDEQELQEKVDEEEQEAMDVNDEAEADADQAADNGGIEHLALRHTGSFIPPRPHPNLLAIQHYPFSVGQILPAQANNKAGV